MAKSGMDILRGLLGGEKKFFDAYRLVEKQDQQSAKLLQDTFYKIAGELDLSSGAEHALSRMVGVVENAKRWDIALLRNNIFKAANSVGLKLPSGMFASDLESRVRKLAKEKPELRKHLIPLLRDACEEDNG
jgi:hypothetical protein